MGAFPTFKIKGGSGSEVKSILIANGYSIRDQTDGILVSCHDKNSEVYLVFDPDFPEFFVIFRNFWVKRHRDLADEIATLLKKHGGVEAMEEYTRKVEGIEKGDNEQALQ
jgi:hypothetical protein